MNLTLLLVTWHNMQIFSWSHASDTVQVCEAEMTNVGLLRSDDLFVFPKRSNAWLPPSTWDPFAGGSNPGGGTRGTLVSGSPGNGLKGEKASQRRHPSRPCHAPSDLKPYATNWKNGPCAARTVDTWLLKKRIINK